VREAVAKVLGIPTEPLAERLRVATEPLAGRAGLPPEALEPVVEPVPPGFGDDAPPPAMVARRR